jgi:hypothetical protein
VRHDPHPGPASPRSGPRTNDQLDERLRGRVRRAHALVARRLADARSHAASGAIEAAASRVDELGQGLSFALAVARGEFYRRAFRHQDPAIHDMDQSPTRESEQAMRTLPIAGHDQYSDLAQPLAEVIVQLRGATSAAADNAVGHQLRHALLAGWEGRHRGRIAQGLRTSKSLPPNGLRRRWPMVCA